MLLCGNKLPIHGKCCFPMLPLFKTFLSDLSKIKYLAFFITFCFVVSLAKMVTLTTNIVYKKSAQYRKYIWWCVPCLASLSYMHYAALHCADLMPLSGLLSGPKRDNLLI